MPIEGWPANYTRDPKLKGTTLDDLQRDKLKENGDRHAIVVDPTNRVLYEFYQMKKTDGGWQASNEATFDLKSNKLRTDGWTSTDAAGLPIFPAVIRYDELKRRGPVDHAMQVTVEKDAPGPTCTRRRITRVTVEPSREPAPHGRAHPVAEGFRHASRVLAGGEDDSGGA